MGCNCGKANERVYYLICPSCGSIKPKKGKKEKLMKTEKCFNCDHHPITVRRKLNGRISNPRRPIQK